MPPTGRNRWAGLQFVPGIPLNQQGDEGANFCVLEPGCHAIQAFIYRTRLQPGGELSVELISDDLKIRVDAGVTWAGVKRPSTGHACNLARDWLASP